MLRIVICDDDPLIVNYLERETPPLLDEPCLCKGFTSAFAAEYFIEHTSEGQVDLLLLDIELGERNGIELSERLQLQYPLLKIIFLTGYRELAEDIFQAYPSGLIFKPIRLDRLKAILAKAIAQLRAERGQSLSVELRGAVISIPLRQIQYIESDKRSLNIHEVGQIRTVVGRLDEMEKQVDSRFVRCHKSFLVNLDFVRTLENHSFVLLDGQQIPISPARYQKTWQTFIQHLGDTL